MSAAFNYGLADVTQRTFSMSDSEISEGPAVVAEISRNNKSLTWLNETTLVAMQPIESNRLMYLQAF